MNFYERMKEESVELSEKISKLNTFTATEAFENLDRVNQRFLIEQCAFMQSYSQILRMRITYNKPDSSPAVGSGGAV